MTQEGVQESSVRTAGSDGSVWSSCNLTVPPVRVYSAGAGVPPGKTQAISLGVPRSGLRGPDFKEFGATDLVGSTEGYKRESLVLQQPFLALWDALFGGCNDRNTFTGAAGRGPAQLDSQRWVPSDSFVARYSFPLRKPDANTITWFK